MSITTSVKKKKKKKDNFDITSVPQANVDLPTNSFQQSSRDAAQRVRDITEQLKNPGLDPEKRAGLEVDRGNQERVRDRLAAQAGVNKAAMNPQPSKPIHQGSDEFWEATKGDHAKIPDAQRRLIDSGQGLDGRGASRTNDAPKTMNLHSSSSSKTVQEAQLTEEEADELGARGEANQMMREGEDDKAIEAIDQRDDELDGDLEKNKWSGWESKLRVIDTKKAAEDAEKEVDKHKTKGFWETRTTTEKVLWGIGIALSGIGKTLSKNKGPNGAARSLDQAISADTKRQEKIYAKKIRKAGLTKADAKAALAESKFIFAQKRALTADKVSLILKKRAINASSADAAQAFLNTEAKLKTMSKDRVTKNYQSSNRQIINPEWMSNEKFINAEKMAVVKGEKLAEKPAAAYNDVMNSIRAMQKLRAAYEKFSPNQYSDFWGGSSAKYNALKRDVVMMTVRALSGVQARKDEIERVKKIFAKGFGPGEWSTEMGLWKLDQVMDKLKSSAQQWQRSHPALREHTPRQLMGLVDSQLMPVDANNEYLPPQSRAQRPQPFGVDSMQSKYEPQ